MKGRALALALGVLWASALCADPTEETPGGAADGAHEYIEAYLLVQDLPNAEEHAALQRICLVPCEEHADLARAIAAYRRDGRR